MAGNPDAEAAVQAVHVRSVLRARYTPKISRRCCIPPGQVWDELFTARELLAPLASIDLSPIGPVPIASR
jgi:hypothetical protein